MFIHHDVFKSCTNNRYLACYEMKFSFALQHYINKGSQVLCMQSSVDFQSVSAFTTKYLNSQSDV